MTHSDPAARAEDRLDKLDRWLYRNRHVAGPPALAVLMLSVGWLAHVTSVEWTASAVTAVVLVLASDHMLDLPSAREKWYALACWAGGCGWTVAVAWLGVTVWLAAMLGLGTLALGIPWAHHRRVRRGVDVDRAIEAWGDGAAVGLKGTRARGKKAGDGWFSFKLAADEPGTFTLSDYKQRAHRIAARFSVRADAVSFATVSHEGEVEVTIRDGEQQQFDAADDPSGPLSMVGPFRVGATDSGEPIEQAFYLEGRGAQHGAAVGATGSGKSSLMNRHAEQAARSTDALLWVVDLSYGAKELRGWAPVADWFAYNTAQVEHMLDVLPRICESRGGGQGRQHKPSPSEPGIVLLIDEGASVWAPALVSPEAETTQRLMADRVAATRREKAGELLRLARKYGVSVHEATQYGDQDALGGPAAKQQLGSGYATVFYSRANTDGHLLIPAGQGIRCSEFPQSKPGTMATKGPTIDGTVRGRIDWTSDERRDQVVALWRDNQPTLEARAMAAAGDAYAGRNRTAPGDTDDGDGGESAGETPSPRPGVPDFTKARRTPDSGSVPGRLSPDESRQLVWDTLAGFGDAAYPKQVAEACSKSADLVGMRLRELRDEGRVERLKGGRWQVRRGTEQRRIEN